MAPPVAVWETTSAEATRAIGQLLGEACAGGETIALIGPLGAGKTCLVRGLAAGLGAPAEAVTSPTFVLIHEYAGRVPLYHVDLYRLDARDAVNGLGLEEYVDSAGVTVIEWADRAPAVLPGDHLRVAIEHLGGDRRRVTLHPQGARPAALAAQVAARHPGTGGA
ncbi:MAG: tRNA (adenosine(37)-N6)-threonylcarbamoyltransferase complex ATPase subunit type 1 TsaE [Nitrospirae bacterium]|nr:MAG: tRNA (adenosine(37)-N6)-threonylcarbamoyltransferase complex ATPase subunit type 1 TsaE [Nitrospirota bacterium]